MIRAWANIGNLAPVQISNLKSYDERSAATSAGTVIYPAHITIHPQAFTELLNRIYFPPSTNGSGCPSNVPSHKKFFGASGNWLECVKAPLPGQLLKSKS